MTYVIIWDFEVPSERRSAFEVAYGPDGDWSRLFRQADGFEGVELLRCGQMPGRYLTVDRWRDRRDFEAFKQRFGEAYAALDREFETLTRAERPIGTFDAVM